jgi:hypothetical protein
VVNRAFVFQRTEKEQLRMFMRMCFDSSCGASHDSPAGCGFASVHDAPYPVASFGPPGFVLLLHVEPSVGGGNKGNGKKARKGLHEP